MQKVFVCQGTQQFSDRKTRLVNVPILTPISGFLVATEDDHDRLIVDVRPMNLATYRSLIAASVWEISCAAEVQHLSAGGPSK